MDADELAELRSRVTKLEDTHAACALLHTYARVLDDPIPETVTALFASDATLSTPSGTVRGTDEIRGFFGKAFAADPSIKRHFIVNPRTTSLGERRVRIESSFFFTGRGERRSVLGWGTYDDVIDVGGAQPRFLAKVIVLEVGTDLDAGWALPDVQPS